MVNYFLNNKLNYSYYEILLLLLSKTPRIYDLIVQISNFTIFKGSPV